MRTFFLLLAITATMLSNAQITKVSLQASGLTCSMCSNSITKALRTLDFVEKISADLKTYTYEITFRQGSQIDFDRIRQKVEGAGFSISGFIATINFNNVQVSKDKAITIEGQSFLFTTAKEQLLNGLRQVTIIERGFVPAKWARRNSLPPSSPGTFRVAI